MQRRNEWFYPRGGLERDGWQTVVDATTPGWAHTGLRVAELGDGTQLALPQDGHERIVVPLAGSFTVTYGGSEPIEKTELEGRASVFDGPTDVLYLSSAVAATITGSGRVAVAEAPTTAVYPSVYIPRSDVPVELRGAGRSSRQVHNFGTPGALDADKLIVCEVITPSENWSSYPPHKHDENIPGTESRLEEIYYFESAVSKGLAAPSAADPFGYMRTYASAAGEIDILAEVRTGDVGLVPHGWHGPCVAAPGYDLYYLNVMAGPDAAREWLISDDPAHGWVRDTWQGQEFDSRLPYTQSEGTTA
ncbi:5-deoxy-glucuronate isomerase [Agreia sp. COWG]|uniref:5-deoxy-glucuronate isomerase n=1 Tax=Agreia sp. COWG TaxID=2773266 RepID=UPI001926E515|nr:5-deoxy-glucuronate isomerase [Agreia sp. COWG]CAD5989706.1 5-deoxy-glucuronate isomerase [Agreia sp. COWG]